MAFSVTQTLESLEQRVLLAATWTSLTHGAPLGSGTMNLLTDGSVIMTDGGSGWQRLVPDSSGSYINGTWTRLASAHHTRLYDATQVLQDGRLFVAGGEYGTGSANGEVYNPMTNAWLSLPTQTYGSFIDSGSFLLPDGRVLVSPVAPTPSGYTTIYNPFTNAWSQGPKLFRGGSTDEQSFVKLPDDSIITIDGSATSERYIPSLNQWVNDGTVPVNMFDGLGEIGPGLRLPDGRAFFIGANSHTALYTPSGTNSPGAWVAGPDLPAGLGADDAPAAVLPDGRVLLLLGPSGTYNGPTSFYMYDPTVGATGQLTAVSGAPSIGSAPYVSRMLALPNGDVLCNLAGQMYDYNPGTTAMAAAKPAITGIVANANGSMTLSGTGLNGINAGAGYGDDAQMDSNYPIVRFTNGSNVYYARTYSWSSTGVATGATPETTNFTLPLGIPAGTYSVFLVANGVASDPSSVTISTTAGNVAPTVATPAAATPTAVVGTTTALSVLGADDAGESNLTYTWKTTSVPSGANLPSFSGNGDNAAKNVTATFSVVGAYTFNVTITDAGGLSVTSSVSVNVSQTLTTTSVTPNPASIGGGATQQFNAVAYDQFGNAMSAQPTFTWAVTAGTGNINASGLYTALNTGTLATISATTGTFVTTVQAGVVTAPWASKDVGSVGLAGTAYDNGTTFTIKSSGSDIWGTADQFHYIYRTMNGDGMITARVATQQNTGSSSKVGVMIRNTLLPNDKYVIEAVTPSNGTEFQYRTTASTNSAATGGTGGLKAPYWVRLVRTGGTITGYRSADGITWVQDGSIAITMGATLYIGLEADSNNNTVLNTSTLDNVSVMAALNDSLTVAQGTSNGVNVLTNDTGPNGATLNVTGLTQGAKGSVVNSGNGVLTYTPNANAIGADSFTYTASDGLGDTATATVNVTIIGLKAYYKFDEGTGSTTADATTSGFTASLTGTTWSAGVEGTNGLAFNGTTSYASVPATNLNSNTVTISGWVKRNGSQSAFAGLVFSRTQNTISGLHFGTANELRYTWNNASTTYNWNSGLTVPNGQWTFVALVITPSNATIYMQPQGASMQSAVNSVTNATSPFEGVTDIGQDPAGGRFFNGSLDEVRIYNVALDPTTVAGLANLAPTVATAAQATPTPVTSTTTALSVLGASVAGESALTYTWSATTVPTGASVPTYNINGTNAAKNCTARFYQSGNYTLTCTISDGTLSTTSAVAISVNQTFSAIAVSPTASSLIMGGTASFAANGLDQFGLAMAIQPTFVWSVSGAGDGISSAGLMTAGNVAGSFTVTATSGTINGTATATVLQATIANRAIFYNNSYFDSRDAGPDYASDNAAIATDKAALLPGQTATAANYTSYYHGINGIILDVANLPAAGVTAQDFSFTAANSTTPGSWPAAPAPASVTIFRGQGAGGSDRIELIWDDYAIHDTWLQVTLSTTHSGLAAADTFYFGNLVGETGNNPTSAIVNTTDIAIAKLSIGPNIPITSIADFNRDGFVSTTDIAIAKLSVGHILAFPFTAPAAPAATPAAAAPTMASKSVVAAVRRAANPPTPQVNIAPVIPPLAVPQPRASAAKKNDVWNE